MERIPRGSSPKELRNAFQRREARGDIPVQGAAGEILVGVAVGSLPTWTTDLITLTSLVVDNITIDGATIISDTGAIGFGNENLTTTGTISGINVTSAENPGHTHTGISLSGIDISDDTNLAVTSPITLTDDTVGLDQSAVDHGSIGGLADDDHTQYSLADGTRAFTGTVSGVDPTVSSHLATKEYVDQNVQFEFEYFLNNSASDIGGIYYDMLDESTGGIESNFSSGALGTGDGQAFVNWSTVAGVPGVTSLNAGIYSMHFHAIRTGGNKPIKLYFEAYRREADTTETLIATSEETGYIIGVEGKYDIHATVTSDVSILVADRIVFKVLANVEASGANVTVEIHAEGDTTSHAQLPTSTEVLSSIFLRQDGTRALTGDLAVDAGITIDGRDLRLDGQDLDTLVFNVGKVKIDTNATVDYLGAAFNDGALRTGTGISYADGGNFVTLTTNDGEIAHDSLSGYDSNDHIDHTTVSVSSGNGLTGGGTIDGNQTLALDINGLSVAGIAAGDFVPFWDITATATNKKITFANLEGTLTHDNLIAGTIADHDTTATGANLTSLTNNSMVDALHRHSELSASDGTPDAALVLNGSGNITGTGFTGGTYSLLLSNGFNAGLTVFFLENDTTNHKTDLRMYGTNHGGTLAGISTNDMAAWVAQSDVSTLMFLTAAPTTPIVFATNVIERARITGAGDFGINSTPDARFEVETEASEGHQAITIDQNDVDQAFIDFQGTSAANTANNITTWTTGNSIQGFTKQEVNGAAVWIPHYDAPTS